MDASTKVALLDEGNFHVWRPRIEEVLEDQNLIPAWSRRNFPRNYPSKTADDLAMSTKAALLICSSVSPEVLHRVPGCDLLLPALLMGHLAMCSKSFRFLDIPAELRNRVYEYYLDEPAPYKDNTSHFSFGSNHFPNEFKGRPPSITQVNKQLRHETRKLYFTTSTFSFDFWHLKGVADEDHGKVITDKIRQWAERVGGADLRHMRKLEVCKGYYDMVAIIEFSDQEGLEVKPYKRVGRADRRFKDLLPTVEANRKALGLKGESIIMLLLQDPEIWVPEDGCEPDD